MRRWLIGLWSMVLVVSCSILPERAAFPFQWVVWEDVEQHYDGTLTEVEAATETYKGYNSGVALNLCRGRYSFIFERLDQHNPQAYVDLIVSTLPYAQRIVLDKEGLARYDLDAQGTLQIFFTTSYQPERFLYSWQALDLIETCPMLDGLPPGLLSPTIEDVVMVGDVLPLPSALSESSLEPNDKELSYIIELSWDSIVDLDLGSQLIETSPLIDWRNPRWAMPNKEGFLIADRNSSCLSARQQEAEEFHWQMRLPLDADTSRYDDDLRFLITYQSDCTRRALNPSVRYNLSVVTYVPKPVFDKIKHPPLCEVEMGECRTKFVVVGFEQEKRVLATLAGCSIQLGQTWRFKLSEIQNAACEGFGEDVTNNLLLRP